MSEIDYYTYISFDIFDTLVKRNVLNPKDIFTIVQERYNRKNATSIYNFTEQRVIAEQQLRVASQHEVRLEDIYTKLSEIYGQNVALQLKSLECQTEIDLSCANQSIKEIYDECIRNGKKILIITDMYLDRETICLILKKCGYFEYEKLYISSEIGLTKDSGKLFQYVMKDMKIARSDWLHIGDNLKSDYYQAIKTGIHAKHIHTFENHMKYFRIPQHCTLSESMISATINNNLNAQSSFWEHIGCEGFGPLLVGFVNWLIQELNIENISKVFFLARDGYMIQKVFDMTKTKGITSHYLYVSRRATQVPTFYINSEYENVFTSFFLPRTIKFEVLIKKLGLLYEQVEDIARQYHFSRNDIIECRHIKTNQQLKAFYEHIKDTVVENSHREYNALVRYLKQNEFIGKIAIVDIGWFGNIQAALEKICQHANIDVKIYGYYIGLNPEGKLQDSMNMKGYLFSKSHNQWLYPYEKMFNSVLETFFLANHGSVKKFYLKNERAEVEFYPYECEDSNMENEVRILQDSALSFAHQWYKVDDHVNMNIKPEFAFQALRLIGVTPDSECARKFGAWKFFDIENSYIAQPKHLIRYLISPKCFAHDLNNAKWKTGFLKRIFRIRLPYFKIWMKIRRVYIRFIIKSK